MTAAQMERGQELQERSREVLRDRAPRTSKKSITELLDRVNQFRPHTVHVLAAPAT